MVKKSMNSVTHSKVKKKGIINELLYRIVGKRSII